VIGAPDLAVISYSIDDEIAQIEGVANELLEVAPASGYAEGTVLAANVV
jgi:hypothetical protein